MAQNKKRLEMRKEREALGERKCAGSGKNPARSRLS
jgi:hypothetical protein